MRHYGGLWLEEDISVELAKLKTDPDKRLALKIQINFRNIVLESKCDKILFYMSFGGKVRPVDELIENLIKVINWTKRICNTPFEEPTDIPLLLSKSSQLKKQKAKFCEKAKQQKERDLQPPPCKKYCSMPKRKKTNKKQMKSKI